MNSMGLRQKALMAAFVVIVMYAIAAGTWFFSAQRQWRTAVNRYEKACADVKDRVSLISKKRTFAEAYEAEKAAMPTFAVDDRRTDTTWQAKVRAIAKKHNLLIRGAQAGADIEREEVLVLPIEVSNWESCLESLVKFMHELENTNEGMFDITQLDFRPNPSKPGYLRGSRMTINCAYMRED